MNWIASACDPDAKAFLWLNEDATHDTFDLLRRQAQIFETMMAPSLRRPFNPPYAYEGQIFSCTDLVTIALYHPLQYGQSE